jgi:general secretion pathway protein D
MKCSMMISGMMLIALGLPPEAGAKPVPQTAPSTRGATSDGFTLAFVDADVRRVADAVLGSMLATNYSVDPAVTGNITLRTAQPVTRAALVPLLEAALRAVDAVIVYDGHDYRVMPRSAARSRAPITTGGTTSGSGEVASTDSSKPGFATEVITLNKGSAREIARLLAQFLGKEIVGGTDPARNQVIIAGDAEERQAARDIIRRFDVDALATMNFEVYKLDNVDAETLVNELEKIFAPPYDIIGTRVRVVPLPRLRSVLAIAADRGDLARIEPWIRRLDAGSSGKRKLYNYAVQNGRARDLARSLQLVLGMGDSGGGSPASSAPSPVRTASNEGQSSISGLTPALGEDRSRASGEGASDAQSGSATAVTTSTGARIVPNEENNSLLIYANGEDYDFIREALQKLDQPVAQVLIEATLAEVTLTNDLSYGVDWSFASGRSTLVNSTNSGGTLSPSYPGFSYSFVGKSVSAILNTLQSKTNVRVLSAPKLMVLNNQPATLQVGDQVPIVTQQAQSVASPGAPIVNTIELRDTGVILKVTPRVNDSGTIILDIAQEVSDVATTTTSGINSPTIQQRRLTTTVATRSGQMIALGGLIRDRTTKGRSGIPLLSQIPVVGGAFGRQTTVGTRTELIILITPTVIRSPQEIRNVVDGLIDGLDVARPLVDRAIRQQVGGHAPKTP